MDNPVKKYLDKFLDRRIALKMSPGKTPPIPIDDPLKKDPTSFVMDWFKVFEQLYRHELNDWNEARAARRSPINPYTWQLQQLYKDAMVDNILSSQIRSRILRITNKSMLLKNAGGEIDVERSLFIQAKWFRKIMRQALESRFFGYSLVYINDWENGKIKDVKIIPREHVIPERDLFLRNVNNYFDGLHISDFPNFLIYMQLGDDAVGMLENIAPLTILKRHSWASWDEFEQIFGIPLRVAKTANYTEKNLNELETMLQGMGSAAYAILHNTDELDIKQNNQTDAYGVFNEKRKAINEEICIAINGQSMTSIQGSSRSQAEVHERTQEEITDDDIIDIEDWFNSGFIDVMRNLGYDIPSGYYLNITANTEMEIQDRAKVDLMVSQMGLQLDIDYIQETYNVILDKANPRKTPSAPGEPPNSLSFFV
jgi:uncharacterized protein YoxC